MILVARRLWFIRLRPGMACFMFQSEKAGPLKSIIIIFIPKQTTVFGLKCGNHAKVGPFANLVTYSLSTLNNSAISLVYMLLPLAWL